MSKIQVNATSGQVTVTIDRKYARKLGYVQGTEIDQRINSLGHLELVVLSHPERVTSQGDRDVRTSGS